MTAAADVPPDPDRPRTPHERQKEGRNLTRVMWLVFGVLVLSQLLSWGYTTYAIRAYDQGSCTVLAIQVRTPHSVKLHQAYVALYKQRGCG